MALTRAEGLRGSVWLPDRFVAAMRRPGHERWRSRGSRQASRSEEPSHWAGGLSRALQSPILLSSLVPSEEEGTPDVGVDG